MKLRNLFYDIIFVSWSLFKVLIPTLIVVKIAQDTGLVDILNFCFDPVTNLIGLPSELTIVLTTTILTNPYVGVIILASSGIPENFTVAQASVLASFMLFTHALPVELAISREAGVKVFFLLIVRILTAIVFCFLVSILLDFFVLLQSSASFSLIEFKPTDAFLDWSVEQVKGLIFIQLVIIILMISLEILRFIGIENLISFLMRPLLRFLGINDRASTIIVVGLTIGLGFGGGLMIKEVRDGNVSGLDAAKSLVFINLFHSIFEDTSLVMLLGPSLFIILICRALFAITATLVIVKILNLMPIKVLNRLIIRNEIFDHNLKE